MKILNLSTKFTWALLALTFCRVHAEPAAREDLPPPAEITGKIMDAEGKGLPFATIRITQTDLGVSTSADGSFSFTVPEGARQITVIITYVGKETLSRTIPASQFKEPLNIYLKNLDLSLKTIEVSGIRKRTAASNSSIIFDREAIEQSQALSVANVLDYLPGQTILKPVASAQGVNTLTLRGAVLPGSSVSALNNSFGISIQMDGVPFSNDGNMQTMNIGSSGSFLAEGQNIAHPPVSTDQARLNGSLYAAYSSVQANNGLDLRQLSAENIESIEVVTGVASARYGDYSTGIVMVNRQAGINPVRVNTRINEGTINTGVNTGFRVSPRLGIMNVSFDYLSSNNDPRNKLKAYQRVGGGLIWTYQQQSLLHFKNTFSLDVNTTLDQTRRDPDDSDQRLAKFKNQNFRVSNRSAWLIKKPWLYNISLNAGFSTGRQESYDQWYLNSRPVLGITDAMETGIFEGHFAPGYYLAMRHIIGKPVSASARLEFSHLLKWGSRINHKIVWGGNYSYTANKGPGMVIDPDRPRFYNSGNKNDRVRPFRIIPPQENLGFYVENQLNGHLFNRPFRTNLGIRADLQNSFSTLSPRLSGSWKLSEKISWNGAFGVAAKAPSISQISPGNIYIDIPLVNDYVGNADESVYLAYTRVVNREHLDIKPYRTYTFETGLSWDLGPVHGGITYFNRLGKNGFTTLNRAEVITLPEYETNTYVPGQKLTYYQTGEENTYLVRHYEIKNGNYDHTNGLEMMLSVDKIAAIQTSLNLSMAWYSTRTMNTLPQLSIPTSLPENLDEKALFGVYGNSGEKMDNIKSTLVTTTHVPSLRLAIMITTELFWMNRIRTLPNSIYPSAYADRYLNYYDLSQKEAQSPEYAHLLRKPLSQTDQVLPSFVYPNVHLRLSKEVGDFLRFSFSAYNVYNIRPVGYNSGGVQYYNGQPAFGAELLFTIK